MTTTGAPDTSWMAPWELWAWEQIRAGNIADLELVPEASRGSTGADMKPVIRPLIILTDNVLEPVPDGDWPPWQFLSPRFIESILLQPTFVAARLLRPIQIASARVAGPVRLKDARLEGSLNFTFMRFDGEVKLQGADVQG